ncbi:ImmA/IrrE family metallo-endopeptidase [Chloroflexota bacterium]
MNKVIKNEEEYKETLVTLERLLDIDPTLGTPENEKLELLTLLVQDYESRSYQSIPPDPVEAIKFRMEQQNLAPRDLIPYIGSRSKVSEVLSRKRPLTISMIRALHSRLGIPASVLIQERNGKLNWDRFPIKQLVNWGWITVPKYIGSISTEEIIRPLFVAAGSLEPQEILYRFSSHVRSGRAMDEYSLKAWSVRILALASKKPLSTKYRPGTLTLEFLRRIAQLSTSEDAPLTVGDFLREYGIRVVVERHLPRTYLDGAAIMVSKVEPVIGLTLRYDRVDNFWFTLMHELAHIALHLENESDVFYDDLDVEDEDDPREREANQLASEALIPQDIWPASPASRQCTPMAVEHLATKLHINPAIVAGRMQHESKSYQLLRNFVGSGEVRKLFPEVNWEVKAI